MNNDNTATISSNIPCDVITDGSISSEEPLVDNNEMVQDESNEDMLESTSTKAKPHRKKRFSDNVLSEPTEIITDSSVSSGDEQRPRRQLNNNSFLMTSSSAALSCSRVVFPVEVKACAIQRIKDGETQVQVARDLQCPISTVASWWHRRASIAPDTSTSDVMSASTSVSFLFIL